MPSWLIPPDKETESAWPDPLASQRPGLGYQAALDLLVGLPWPKEAGVGAAPISATGVVVARLGLEFLAPAQISARPRRARGAYRAVWLPASTTPPTKPGCARWPRPCRLFAAPCFAGKGRADPAMPLPRTPCWIALSSMLIDQLRANGKPCTRTSAAKPQEVAGPVVGCPLERIGTSSSPAASGATWPFLRKPGRLGRAVAARRRRPPSASAFAWNRPSTTGKTGRVVSPEWSLHYLLQATDDPSLLVPASEVWRERGERAELSEPHASTGRRKSCWPGWARRRASARPCERSLRAARPRVVHAERSRRRMPSCARRRACWRQRLWRAGAALVEQARRAAWACGRKHRRPIADVVGQGILSMDIPGGIRLGAGPGRRDR